VQPAQSGRFSVPEAAGSWRPQAEHAARRRWQGGHHGSPVAREIPQGTVCPQTEQARTGREGHREQSGPSAVRRSTGRTRPQPVQVSRFSGAVTKQLAQIGWPCPSRVTGSRMAPQRAHGSVRECAMQVRQTRTPSIGLSMRTTRPQRPQAGRTTPATPAPWSISMNRGIARSGARCPSPVSSAGFFSSAHASFCWYEGRGAARRTAPATVSRPAPGSRAVTMPWMTVTGSRPSSSGHFAHRGRPARSREATGRSFLHAAHGSSRRMQGVQYQS
jgi:hypothetical protein